MLDPTRTDDRRRAGFTLFEVLAAALVLALGGTLMIGSMNADLARMGEARIRLEAGRIADSALADIEATLFDGTAPAPSDSEEEIEGFIVQTRITPVGLLFQNAGAPTPAPDAPPSGVFAVLVAEYPGLPQFMRMIKVKVLWGNQANPDSVERTTIAFDHTAALEALENMQNGGADKGDAS